MMIINISIFISQVSTCIWYANRLCNRKRPAKTARNRSVSVAVRFFGSCHFRQPVAVSVLAKKTKRPDRTGPQNTNIASDMRKEIR